MNFDIIKHHIGNSEINSISARELHEKLEVKKDFSDWIKAQIKRAGLEENIDFIVVWNDSKKEVATLTKNELLIKFKNTHRARALGWQSDYILTLDTAINLIKKIRHNQNSAEAEKYLREFIKQEVIIKEPQRKEIEFFTALQTVLKPMNIKLETQFNVLGYRIDGYIKEFNLAIEYDENHHNSERNKRQDLKRERYIKNKIHCSFIRLKENKDHYENIGLVIDRIFKKKFTKKDRQKEILILLKNSKLSTKELAEKFSVSKSTILRDLKSIDNLQKIKEGRKIFYKI